MEIQNRISLEDDFTSEILEIIERTRDFQKQVQEAKERIDQLNRAKIIVDNREAIKNITETKKQINDIKKNVAVVIAAKDSATESIRKIKGEAKMLVSRPFTVLLKVKDEISKVINSITDKIFSLKTLAIGIVIGGAGKGIYDFTLGQGVKNEGYQTSLRTVLNDPKKGDEALKYSYEQALKTPFRAEEVVNTVLDLATSQLDYKKFLMPLGNLAAVKNRPIDQASFFMSKLASGSMGDAVMQGKDLGISVDMWKSAGMTFDKQGSMTNTPAQAMEAFLQIMKNNHWDKLMDAKSNTAEGLMSNIADTGLSFGRALSGIAKDGQIVSGGPFEVFKKQLVAIQPLMDKLYASEGFKKLTKDVSDLVAVGGQKLTEFFKGFEDPKTIKQYKDSFNQFIADVKAGWDVAREFGKAIGTIGTALKPVFSLVAAHPKLFLGLFAGFEAGKGALSIINTFNNIKKELPGLINSVKTFGTGFINVFKSVGAVLAANPIILIITGIVVAVALLYAAWTNDWGGIREKTAKAITAIKEGFDNFKKAVIEFKDSAIKKAKEEFDKLTDGLIALKDSAVKKTIEKFNDFKKVLKDNQTEIRVTAGILGTIFGPALLVTGVKATIAGTQIAAHFIVSIVKTGAAAVANGAKITVSFVTSMVKSGIEATINGAKITATFVASVIKAGAQAVVSGIKITASFVAAIVKAGAQAVVAGTQIAVGFIAKLIELAAQALITAATITGQLIVSLVSYAAQGWKTVAVVTIQTASFVAQKIAMLASAVATGAVTAATWLFNAALLANPIVLVIAGLTLLGVAIYEVVKHWQEVCTWIEKAWNWLTTWNGTKAEDKTVTFTQTRIDDNRTIGEKAAERAGHNALGTNNWMGGLTWVGELGPELINLPKGTQVINNKTSMEMLNPKTNDMIPQYAKMGENIPTGLISGIKKTSPTLLTSMSTMTEGLIKNFGTGITDNSKYPIKSTNDLTKNITGIFAILGQQSNPLGRNIVAELGQGMSDSGNNLTDVVKTLTNKVIEAFNTGFDIHSPSRVLYAIGSYVMQGFMNGVSSKNLKTFIDKHVKTVIGAFGAAVNVPGGVNEWLTQALMATGTPLSWLPGLQRLVMAESGGDPNNGNPQGVGGEHATGLLQTLPSTFQEFMQKGMNNILNPVDNAASAINYIKSRYGDVYNTPLFRGGPYAGYALGTDYSNSGWHWVGENGPELMKLPGGTQIKDNFTSMKMAKSLMQPLQSGKFSPLLNKENPEVTINLKKDNPKQKGNITIAKLADQIIVREENDIDKIADALVRKINDVAFNMP